MEDKDLNLQADDTLAVLDPEAYVLSNPTPRDWNMTAQDIARSIKVTPFESVTTKEQREGDQLNVVETIGTGIWDSLKRLPKSISSTMDIASIEAYSSPNMTEKEASRLLTDALYTRHYARKAEQTLNAEKIKYNTLYEISNGIGDLIKYAGIGIVSGLPGVAASASAEVYSETEASMVDSYIEKKGTIEGYEKQRNADKGLAGAYAIFSGITEVALGVDRIAAGALGRYSSLEARSRLARMQGKPLQAQAWKAGRTLGMSAVEEGTEEFVQSVGEDVAMYLAGYEDAVFTDENFKKALTSAAYGALIGGPAGWGLYKINRQTIINKINKWNEDKQIGMSEQQVIESADEILDNSRSTMLDEIATRAEIKNQYGKAFETVKDRIGELVDATGVTPWVDENKTKEQYIQDVAYTITAPMINKANIWGMPLSEFLDVAQMNITPTATGFAPILNFEPIASVDDLKRLLDVQNAIIKEETDASKIGNANPDRKENAQRRKAILQYNIRAQELANKRRKQRIEQAGISGDIQNAQDDVKHLKDSPTQADFIGKLSKKAQDSLKDNSGKVSKKKSQDRYQNALLKWVAGNDDELFEKIMLDKTVSQKVIDVLATHGSALYELDSQYPDLGIREDLYHALKKMQVATKDNFLEITQWVENRNVMPENVMIWNWLYADVTTNREFIGNYISTLRNNVENVNAGEDIFGDKNAPLSKKDALIQALKKTDETRAQLSAERGREYESLFTEIGEIRNPELSAAVISYNNQFGVQPTQMSTETLQQFDLADENARLDDIYPEYTGETIEVDGKERTVYNSNGDRIAKSKEALTNFWRWFGDSKVVDEQGRPLVVYHGSDVSGIEVFDNQANQTKQRQIGAEKGYFFTDSKKVAERFRTPEQRKAESKYYAENTVREPVTEEKYDAQGRYLGSVHYTKTTLPESKNFGLYPVYLKAESVNEYSGEDIGVGEERATALESAKQSGKDGVIIYKADTGAGIANEYIVFESNQIKSVDNRGTYSSDTGNIYLQRRAINGFYDPELQAIVLGKHWNETTLVHEFHHRYLEKIWGIYQQAQQGVRTVSPEFMDDVSKLFEMLDIDPSQRQLTTVQQEKFASMVEAYITGLGVDNPENLAFQTFMHWIPEKYKSIMDIGYLDENGLVKNPILDEASIDFFNKWFASPFAPSLPSAPDAQRIVNVTDDKGEIIPSNQKVMNNREKEWGQDSEEQLKADAQLYRAIGENNPSNLRAALDGEEELMKAESKNLDDDRILPEKPKLRDKWFKTRQKDARTLAADKAREYLEKNPEHARELAFADPETMTEFDAPVDHGMLIRAVMETVGKGSDEWYILDNNLAMVKSMSGSTLSLSGDLSHQAYLDAKREVENARELKAAVNYAGTRQGAMDKWNSDIRAFAARRVAAIMATEPNSEERKTAIKAFLEEAKTKFSGNTTNAILNQLDLTGMKTKSSQVFIKWAEKQIKEAAHAKIDTKEQAELMKASVKAQLALRDIDSTELKDGQYARAIQSSKDIRHWQFVKDKMKKAYIGRWGKFGIFWDNLLGGYMPSAMLMSVNTLFFANVPSNVINTGIVRRAARHIGENKVDSKVTEGEIKRIKQIFNASGMNLAQMEKPSSPSTLHGEKYMNTEQAHWYNFTFEILGKTDNLFRIPTFVDALARIATKDAGGDKAKATVLFKEYIKLNNTTEEAKIARKQALAVANMAVFTQDGTMASGLNHIRSQLNNISRGLLGLEPGGFGLGNILAPFLKTGANIAEMGIKATFAPVRQLVQWGKKAAGKEIPELDKLAMRVDWTYFAWTCVATALMAAITSDDDEWYIEPYESGKQYDPDRPYDSIKIGGVWLKLDVLGVFAIPLRTSAMLVKDWETRKLGALGDGMLEALSDTPLVNQFTDSSLGFATRKPDKWASTFVYNQANKLVPAQLKTVTKATSRATDTELDVSILGPTIERKFHRNYGLDGERLTTNDLILLFTNRLKTNPE